MPQQDLGSTPRISLGTNGFVETANNRYWQPLASDMMGVALRNGSIAASVKTVRFPPLNEYPARASQIHAWA